MYTILIKIRRRSADVSVYTTWRIDNYPELNRRVTKREYEKLLDFAVELGVENGYMQEMESAKVCYIPPFDGEGIKA